MRLLDNLADMPGHIVSALLRIGVLDSADEFQSRFHHLVKHHLAFRQINAVLAVPPEPEHYFQRSRRPFHPAMHFSVDDPIHKVVADRTCWHIINNEIGRRIRWPGRHLPIDTHFGNMLRNTSHRVLGFQIKQSITDKSTDGIVGEFLHPNHHPITDLGVFLHLPQKVLEESYYLSVTACLDHLISCLPELKRGQRGGPPAPLTSSKLTPASPRRWHPLHRTRTDRERPPQEARGWHLMPSPYPRRSSHEGRQWSKSPGWSYRQT